ncbi:hypothetical protein Y032_0080g1381 [Ancylostoma ceylanicum]|uniref:Uncharacterized protein n=1 Tax=Ancylostoma ceylanicum TaxID=53326 RepID=A0A016TSQ3_9BILA|nr:hypothetical protein Y032_0080g1381 [Ancylostoma ceylanicum]
MLVSSDTRSGDQGSRRRRAANSEESRMPRATKDELSDAQFEKVLMAMVEQMHLQHEELKKLFAALAFRETPSRRSARIDTIS